MYYYTKFEDLTFSGHCRVFPAVYFVGHGHETVGPLPLSSTMVYAHSFLSDSFTSPVHDVLIFPPLKVHMAIVLALLMAVKYKYRE